MIMGETNERQRLLLQRLGWVQDAEYSSEWADRYYKDCPYPPAPRLYVSPTLIRLYIGDVLTMGFLIDPANIEEDVNKAFLANMSRQWE
jgi:hypothetical protein